jgi:hypothetical protein
MGCQRSAPVGSVFGEYADTQQAHIHVFQVNGLNYCVLVDRMWTRLPEKSQTIVQTIMVLNAKRSKL